MKVVISGSAGTGKTTFARRLSDYTGAVYLPDCMNIVLKEKGFSSPKELDDIVAVPIRLEALDRKIQLEKEEDRFVSDKSVVDYLAYWMICTAPNASIEDNRRFHNRVLNHTCSLKQKPIILPYGAYPLEDDNIRSVDESHQFRVYTLIKRLYKKLNIPFIEYNYSFDQQIDSSTLESLGIS